MNGFYLQFTGTGPSQADMTALATAMNGIWNTRFAPLAVTNVSMTNLDVQDLSSDMGLIGVSSTVRAGTRTASTPLPASVAMVVSWKISRHYRGGHPRTYLTGFNGVDVQNGNTWVSGQITAVQAGMNSFITDVNALTYPTMPLIALASVSYWSNKVQRPTGVPTLISGAQVHSRVDTQRRRLGKEIS